MNQTTNFGLKKPEQSDYYNIDDFNANADVIDTELAARLKQYPYLTDVTGFTASMTTKAFLESMPAHSSIIAIGNEQANFSDAPTTYGLYHFIKGSNDNYMVGKCYGIGQSGEYFYAWSTTNGNGLGWVKNAKTGDLSAYVPMAGTTQEAPITGRIFLDAEAETNYAMLGTYVGATSEYLALALCPKGTRSPVNQIVVYADGTAKIGNTGTILTTDKVRKTLWTGSWSSGNITVPGFTDYSVYEITFSGRGTKILAARHSPYLRGLGGFPHNDTDITIIAMGVEHNGNTLTFGQVKERVFASSNEVSLAISSIIGVV